MSDLIDRQAAIDALKNDMASLDHIIKGMSANDVRLDAYVSQRNQVDYDIYAIKQLPPAQPAPSQVAADIARIVENGKDMRVIEAAQPTPDQNGDLWITVPDIDKVTRIYVQESKSKFCRIFYEEQPERIKGHWIESAGQNILLKKLIEKGETWRACDKCGAGFMIGYQYECDKLYHETFHNFCPKCGADMREVTT